MERERFHCVKAATGYHRELIAPGARPPTDTTPASGCRLRLRHWIAPSDSFTAFSQVSAHPRFVMSAIRTRPASRQRSLLTSHRAPLAAYWPLRCLVLAGTPCVRMRIDRGALPPPLNLPPSAGQSAADAVSHTAQRRARCSSRSDHPANAGGISAAGATAHGQRFSTRAIPGGGLVADRAS